MCSVKQVMSLLKRLPFRFSKHQAQSLILKRPGTYFPLITILLMALLILPRHASASVTNTRVDPWGTSEVSASAWLNGGGTTIYSNGATVDGPSPDTLNYINNINGTSTQTGIEWQCVELVNRLYLSKGWTTSRWPGYGYQLYGNASSMNLVTEAQGYITYVQPGDVIGMSGGSYPYYGHAAIVSSVNGNSITIASQNTTAVYDTSFSLNSGSITMSGWGTYQIQGIIHHPSDISVQSGSTLYTAGAPGSSWTSGGSATYGWWKLAGNRVARYDGNYGLYVSDNPTASSPTWTLVWNTNIASSGSAFAITPDLIAVQSGHELWATTAPGGSWKDEGSATVGYWKIAGSRLAKYDGNVGLKVTDNPTASTPTWTTVWGTNVATSGKAWDIAPKLVSVQSSTNSHLYSIVDPGNSWGDDGSVTFNYWKISGWRLGKFDGNSGLLVTDNPASTTPTWSLVWDTDIASSGQAFAVSPNIITLQENSSSTLYSTGTPGGSWHSDESGTVGYWKVAGNRLAKYDGNSGLLVSDNPTDTTPSWTNVWGTTPSIDSSGQAFSIGLSDLEP